MNGKNISIGATSATSGRAKIRYLIAFLTILFMAYTIAYVNMNQNIKDRGAKILEKLEKYLKTDIKYLIHGGFWLTSGNIISTLASLLLSIAFANLLPKETYGMYRYVLSLASIISITTLTGVDSAVTQAIARNFDHSFFEGLKTKMRWGVLGSLASIACALYYYTQGNNTLTIALLIIGVCVPFTEAFDLYNSILNGKKLFSLYTKYNIATQIGYVLVMVVTLFFTKSVIALVAAFLLSNTILNLACLLLTLKRVELNQKDDPGTAAFGKHLSVMYTLSTILTELDKIIVFHYLGAVDLAIYSFALAPTDQIKGLLKNIHSLAFPKFANRSRLELKDTILSKTWKFGVFMTGGIIIYIILAPVFFQTLFPSYITSVTYSQILAISVIGASLSMFVYTAMESQKAQKELYKFNIITNVLNAIILVPLVYYFGLWGAVAAKIIARFFSLIYSIILVKKLKTETTS